MSKKLRDNFNVRIKQPIDTRFKCNLLSEIELPYEGLKTFQLSDKKFYKYVDGVWQEDNNSVVADIAEINQKLDNSKIVNVRDCGAVGDGITDDTVAFNSALSLGNNIYIPSGTYLINSSISKVVSNSLIIKGGGIKTTRILFDSDDGFYLENSNTDSFILIEHLSIMTKRQSTGTALKIKDTTINTSERYAPTLYLNNIEIQGNPSCRWNYGITLDDILHTKLNYVSISAYGSTIGATGLTIKGINSPVEIQIDSCWFMDYDTGILVQGKTEGVTVNSSVIIGNTYGISWATDNATPQLSVISTHINVGVIPLLIDKCNQANIMNNLLFFNGVSNGFGIYIANGNGAIIQGNQIYNMSGTYTMDGIALTAMTNSIVKDNIIHNGNTGIYVKGTGNTNNSIFNNKIDGTIVTKYINESSYVNNFSDFENTLGTDFELTMDGYRIKTGQRIVTFSAGVASFTFTTPFKSSLKNIIFSINDLPTDFKYMTTSNSDNTVSQIKLKTGNLTYADTVRISFWAIGI